MSTAKSTTEQPLVATEDSQTGKLVDILVNDRKYSIFLTSSESDYIQKKIATEKIPYEKVMLEDMQSRLEEGELVIDVGANIGNHTLYLAAVAGCKVVAFEPNAALAAALEHSIKHNRLQDRIEVYPLALGDKESVGEFAEEIPTNQGAQQVKVGAGSIPVKTLDGQNILSRVAALKIDVEGMEKQVLLGGKKLIKRDMPFIYVECQSEANFREVATLLHSMGYSHWDKFNATPTHLFVPRQAVTQEERIDHLQLKIAESGYQSTLLVSELRQKLNDANLKYRAACEQISELKQRLITVDSSHKLQDEQLRILSEGLKHKEAQLVQEKEREGALRQQLQQECDELKQRLVDANTNYRLTNEERALLVTQLAGMESGGQAREKQLEELRLALGAALEQLAVEKQSHAQDLAELKQQLVKVDTACKLQEEQLHALNEQLQGKEMQLEQQREGGETLRQQLLQERDELKRRLADVSENYRLANEERALQHTRLAEREARLQERARDAEETEKRLVRLTADAEFLGVRLEEARAQHKYAESSLEELQQRFQGESTARQLNEAEARRLKQELETQTRALQQRCEDLSGQLHVANEQARGLTEKLSGVQLRLRESELGQTQREQQFKKLEQQLGTTTSQSQLLSRQNLQLEQQLTQQQAENKLVAQVTENIKVQAAYERKLHGEEIRKLDKQLKAREEACLRSMRDLGKAQVETESIKGRFELIQEKNHELSRDLSALRYQLKQETGLLNGASSEVERLQEALTVANAAREQDLAGYIAQLQGLQQQIGELEASGKLAVDKLNASEQSLDEARSQLAHANSQWQHELEQERHRLTEQTALLTEANEKYRYACEQVDGLKNQLNNASANREEFKQLNKQLEAAQQHKREQDHALEQLKLEALQSKKSLYEANRQLEGIRQQARAAEHQVTKARASLSFQLGYLLIHGFKSFDAFRKLPGSLWALHKEAKRRRIQREGAFQKTVPNLAKRPVRLAGPVVVPAMQSLSNIQQTNPLGSLAGLKVACIMDEFTYGSYSPECQLQQLTPSKWDSELEGFQPELLFIESAWRGKDELWGSKVGHTSKELQGIVAWCQEHKVPTVFWNKEDPVHFETFLSTAKLFDYVFTTDIDCIHRYKAALGHERVYLLPFACQPANNNPIETYPRKDAFCFAGAYYVRYPERTRDLGNFVAELPAFRQLEIYDRNYGKNDPNYQFPPEYQPYIVGTLPFDQIEKAYKGYRYAINLNSIKQSQTMFARRVYELLGCNTITVSNFSRGVRLLFGDLVITTDSGNEMLRHLKKLEEHEAGARKFRLAGLRKVMQEHTYERRLAYVVSKVKGLPQQNSLPDIAVTGYVKNQSQFDSLVAAYQRQNYTHTCLNLVLGQDFVPASIPADLRISVIDSRETHDQTVGDLAGRSALVTVMVPDDHYGPNYLLDLALATTYSQAEAIGKVAHYILSDNSGLKLANPGSQYRPARKLAVRSAVVRGALVATIPLREWIGDLYTRYIETANGLAIDEFNYCKNGAALEADGLAEVSDLAGIDSGIGIDELHARAERIAPEESSEDAGTVLSGKALSAFFAKEPSKHIALLVEGESWRVSSTLPDGKHEYLYATQDLSLAEAGFEREAKFYFDVSPGLNLQLVLVFLDEKKQKISHVIKHAGRNQQADIPVGTAWIRLGLRIYAGGNADIKGLVLGHRDLQPAEMIGQAEHLVLTNHYPSYEDLYRNGFVHSRVRAYRERGVRADVFRLRPSEAVSYHEFEDVDVTTGDQAVLHQLLTSGQYKSVLVHFLDPAMWEVLQHHIDRIKVVVWVHGAEIQPWWRRDYNYRTEDERTVAKTQSEKRLAFWRGLLQSVPTNLKLVFVSRYFAEEVMEDLGFRIPESHYTIIHNPINTELFSYEEKPVEQRKKVLSIRPYASAKYANDLSVKAILQLSEKSWFNEMEFRLMGDGPLFEETLAPLREFRNVYIERRFMKQDEIAALHKEYGIFLCPTRMDAQGVSRDEAMASGLVPVTNGVTAIPEFVDDSCGILASGEDAVAMAEGIERIYLDEKLFQSMSSQASRRVAKQSGQDHVISMEMSVFK